MIGLRTTIALGAVGLWIAAAFLAISVIGSVGEISLTDEIQIEPSNS